MSETAKITFTTGPDRGKEFELADDLVHIGRSADNQIVLEDTVLADRQASIVRRNDRYAIYTSIESTVEIDGSVIPAERWVWLPSRGTVRLGKRTAFEFHQGEANQSSAPVQIDTGEQPNGKETERPPAPRKGKKRSRRRPGGKSTREVAKFITNTSGESTVQLGEDGELPELSLIEPSIRKPVEKRSEGSSAVILYVVLGISFASSLLLLFLESPTTSPVDRSQARIEIVRFYGSDSDELLPYQQLLRDARRDATRGDYSGERDAYLAVLRILNSEDINPHTGITGSPEDDEKLKQLIGLLLSR